MKTEISPRSYECPIYQFFELFGKKWTLHIFQSIGDGYYSFSSLMTRLPALNSKVLSERLDTLIEQELIVRTVSQSKPLKITYTHSEKGQLIYYELQKLNRWILEHPL